MLSPRDTAACASTGLWSLSSKASCSDSAGGSNESHRNGLLDRTLDPRQALSDAHPTTTRESNNTRSGGTASRSSRSPDGVLGQWVPRPPDSERTFGLSNPRRLQPSPPLHQPLQSRSGTLRGQFSLLSSRSRMTSPRQQLTMQRLTPTETCAAGSTTRGDQLVSRCSLLDCSTHQGDGTSSTSTASWKGNSRRRESPVDTCRHLAAELLGGCVPVVEFPAASEGTVPECDANTKPLPLDNRLHRSVLRDGDPPKNLEEDAPLPPRQPLVVDVQLELPPRAFFLGGAHQREQRMARSLAMSSNAAGETQLMPKEEEGTTPTVVDTVVYLERALQDIRMNIAGHPQTPCTQELLAGLVRVTPPSQQSRRINLSSSREGNKKIGSETSNSFLQQAAAIGIQAAVRGAQRRAQIAQTAAREVQSLRSTVDSYERSVLPQIMVGSAVGQGLLRSELAEVSAERDSLVEKLAERDREASEARQDAAAAKADCAAMRLRMSDSNQATTSWRAGVDQRLGGA